MKFFFFLYAWTSTTNEKLFDWKKKIFDHLFSSRNIMELFTRIQWIKNVLSHEMNKCDARYEIFIFKTM